MAVFYPSAYFGELVIPTVVAMELCSWNILRIHLFSAT